MLRVLPTALLLLAARLATAAPAAPPPIHDVYLDLDETAAAALRADWPGAELRPLLPRPLLEKASPDGAFLGWHRLRPPGAPDADSLAAALLERPGVRAAEAVPVQRTSGQQPDDPGYRAQWHLDRIGAAEAWRTTRGSRAVRVAILDTGVDIGHDDLADRVWINPGEDLDGDGRWTAADDNGVDDDGNGHVDDLAGWDFVDLPPSSLWPGEDGSPPDNDVSDFDGHGTHCAGDAAATGFDGAGVAGGAAEVSLVGIRVGYQASDGMGYVAYGLEGLVLSAAYGVDVVSMSYGGPGFSNMTQQAVNALAFQRAVCVAAAGNESSQTIGYPAGYAHVLAIGATDEGDGRAGFSNYGDWVDLGSPGERIWSTAAGGGWAVMQGTSMATPLAAGVCALLKSLRPDWGPEEVLQRLSDTAVPMPGQGLGAGRIDAAAAVAFAPRAVSAGVRTADGRLRAGVPATLDVTLRAGDEPIADARLRARSRDGRLQVLEEEVSAGFLQPGEEAGLELTVTALEDGFFEAELELWITDVDTLGTGVVRVPAGEADLLLVDADGSGGWSLASWYLEPFAELGLAVEHRQWPEERDRPLPEPPAALLYTGSDLEPQVDPAGLDSLLAFAAGGGRLVLSGQALASSLPADLLEQRFGAAHDAAGAAGALVWGVDGDSLGGGRRLLLVGSGGASNQTAPEVLALAGAQPVFAWGDGQPERCAALRAPEGDLWLFAFGLEAVNGDPDWAFGRDELLGALFDRETATEPALRPSAFDPALDAWPNPFNPELRLRWSGPGAATVEVFDLLGRAVARWERVPAGGELAWRPRDLASGLYLARARGANGATAVAKLQLLR